MHVSLLPWLVVGDDYKYGRGQLDDGDDDDGGGAGDDGGGDDVDVNGQCTWRSVGD